MSSELTLWYLGSCFECCVYGIPAGPLTLITLAYCPPKLNPFKSGVNCLDLLLDIYKGFCSSLGWNKIFEFLSMLFAEQHKNMLVLVEKTFLK